LPIFKQLQRRSPDLEFCYCAFALNLECSNKLHLIEKTLHLSWYCLHNFVENVMPRRMCALCKRQSQTLGAEHIHFHDIPYKNPERYVFVLIKNEFGSQ
jgi:hypothetical protein